MEATCRYRTDCATGGAEVRNWPRGVIALADPTPIPAVDTGVAALAAAYAEKPDGLLG